MIKEQIKQKRERSAKRKKQCKHCKPVEPETLDVYLADNREETVEMHATLRHRCKHNLISDTL